MKRKILIYSDNQNLSLSAVEEIRAGIEEEGVGCEAVVFETSLPETLAGSAARDSAFGCGIGVSGGAAVLWLLNHAGSVIRTDDAREMRNLGHNSARALKKLPFIM